MNNSDYLKLAKALQSFSRWPHLANHSSNYEPNRKAVLRLKELAQSALNDFENDVTSQHLYTDILVEAIEEFRSNQDSFSALNKDLFTRELWPILDNICPPKPYGDPSFLKKLYKSEAYRKATDSGSLTKRNEWRGSRAALVRWLLDSKLLSEPKNGCLGTSERWRDADMVFIIKGKRVSSGELGLTAGQVRRAKTDEIEAD